MKFTPRVVAETMLTGVLLVYCVRLVWGRGSLFWDAWSDERRAYDLAYVQHRDCESSHETLHTWAAGCALAAETLERWPVVRAWDVLVTHTYLCIEVPCTEMLDGFVSTWTGLLLGGGALCLVVLLLGCSSRKAATAAVAADPPASGEYSYYYPVAEDVALGGIRRRIAYSTAAV